MYRSMDDNMHKYPMDEKPVITNQPISTISQNVSQAHAGYEAPVGWSALQNVDYLRIKQKVELCELCSGCESKNRYKIYNAQGQLLFETKEKSNMCCRTCCPAVRRFDLPIKNKHGDKEMQVFAADGEEIGSVQQTFTWCRPVFDLKDASGNIIYNLQLNPYGEKVGMIRKEYSGVAKELATDADNFYATFPMDDDVRHKAIVLGAVFLLDQIYFENHSDPMLDVEGAPEM